MTPKLLNLLTFFAAGIKSEQVRIPKILERLSSMQLEETASAKDVPPLSTRGVFGLPAFIAQNNMRPQGQVISFYFSPLDERDFLRSLV
jgi:hypothetical protein